MQIVVNVAINVRHVLALALVVLSVLIKIEIYLIAIVKIPTLMMVVIFVKNAHIGVQNVLIYLLVRVVIK